MKLSTKTGWLCGSGVFLITTLPAFFEYITPIGLSAVPLGTMQGMAIIEIIVFGLMGSIMAGGIGYIIGDILGNPQGKAEENTLDNKKSSTLPEQDHETFLSDLKPLPAVPLMDLEDTDGQPADLPLETENSDPEKA